MMVKIQETWITWYSHEIKVVLQKGESFTKRGILGRGNYVYKDQKWERDQYVWDKEKN